MLIVPVLRATGWMSGVVWCGAVRCDGPRMGDSQLLTLIGDSTYLWVFSLSTSED